MHGIIVIIPHLDNDLAATNLANDLVTHLDYDLAATSLGNDLDINLDNDLACCFQFS